MADLVRGVGHGYVEFTTSDAVIVVGAAMLRTALNDRGAKLHEKRTVFPPSTSECVLVEAASHASRQAI